VRQGVTDPQAIRFVTQETTMKRLPFLILVLGTGPLALQAQNHNRVKRNNNPWAVLSTAKHTTTQRAYNWPPSSPAGFAPGGGGVASGTRTIRWIPSMVSLRRETRLVSGYQLGIRPSAATPGAMTGYFPQVSFHVPRLLTGSGTWANGAQYSADLTVPAIVTFAQTSQALPSTGNFVFFRTIGTPVAINETEIVMSARWDANGLTTPINDDNPGHQSFFGSYADGIHSPVTVQFASPTNILTPISTGFSVTWFSYFEEAPVVQQKSDWGHRRNSVQYPGISGYSIGTGQSDLASVAGQLGWDVDAGIGFAGDLAVPLFNFGPVFPLAFQVLGQTIELNVADPHLGLLAGAGYVLTLDATGSAIGPWLLLPSLGPPALYTTIGVEFVTARPNPSALTGSTQSAWITITR
jgi:hypothetical protein